MKNHQLSTNFDGFADLNFRNLLSRKKNSICSNFDEALYFKFG